MATSISIVPQQELETYIRALVKNTHLNLTVPKIQEKAQLHFQAKIPIYRIKDILKEYDLTKKERYKLRDFLKKYQRVPRDKHLSIQNLTFYTSPDARAYFAQLRPCTIHDEDRFPLEYRLDVQIAKEVMPDKNYRMIPVLIFTPCLFRKQIPKLLCQHFADTGDLTIPWTSTEKIELAPLPYVDEQHRWTPTDGITEKDVLEMYNRPECNVDYRDLKKALKADFMCLWKERMDIIEKHPIPTRMDLRQTMTKSDRRTSLQNISIYTEGQQIWYTLNTYGDRSVRQKLIKGELYNKCKETQFKDYHTATPKSFWNKQASLRKRGVEPFAYPMSNLSMMMKRGHDVMRYDGFHIDVNYCLRRAMNSQLLHSLLEDVHIIRQANYTLSKK